ncbi:helix-turn-helix transcriptional regulator [Bradyrhizobium viridifuturi]|uniref:helix-turn-helix transcriptional regulator n=1 Tax=Bradyrhizobium viridifuturi TaxID=1654716 RepID=UPI0019106B21|nr:DNA-binding protein [Bradyrhizobium viridifuturi]
MTSGAARRDSEETRIINLSASARAITLPRLALRRDEAATAFSISPTLFDQWIERGFMPKGRKIGGVVLWDTDELRQAWCDLRDADGSPKQNPFDGVVA